ncbi:hypothetical protein [Roseomonas sp. AR75]|uniref:hypothetical protein n=1 Tax=Roseomonas sp. AR75 TaxID=2562311 RepID=UPI0010C13BE6|nr:hypothetical protein [Roseomonas sp. AR75]
MLRTIILAGLAALCLGLAPARAATYSFSYTDTTGGGDDYSGLLTVNGGLVTGISGTSAQYGTISGLLPAGTSFGGGTPSDNVFSASAPFLTQGGIWFTTQVMPVGLYTAFGDFFSVTSQGGSSVGTFTATLVPGPGPEPVPAPGALAVLLAGVAGLGLARGAAAERRLRTAR